MIWLWAFLLVIVLVLCWLLNIVGLPGNWIHVVVVAFYAWLIPNDPLVAADVGWVVLGILLALATIGEIVEFAAGSAGAASAGGSKRGAALAIVGALVGSVVGLFISLPIPVPIVAQLITSVLFSAIGALLGAMLGEQWRGRNLEDSFWIGHAAFWGRLLGTLGKIVVGAVMLGVVTLAILVSFA